MPAQHDPNGYQHRLLTLLTENERRTIRELQALAKISSTSVVKYHLNRLADRGLIEFGPRGTSRNIQLVRAHDASPGAGSGQGENVSGQYWLLQINCGQPVLRGPYESDEARINEFDMCLIGPGTEYIIFIDPGSVPSPTTPYAWKPSQDYVRERLDYIEQLEDK